MAPLHIARNLSGVRRCPHCAIASPLLTSLWRQSVSLAPDRLASQEAAAAAKLWGVYECSSCHYLVLAEGQLHVSDSQGRIIGGEAEPLEKLYPSVVAIDDALPTSAKKFLEQAVETLHAPDASAVMAASAVDSMLKAKGLTSGSLYDRIKQAVEQHILTEAMGRWAHAVRLEANSVRHADKERPHLSAQDARRVVDFARALGDFLFVLTARVEAGIEAAQEPANP